jgi:hypothetical protein
MSPHFRKLTFYGYNVWVEVLKYKELNTTVFYRNGALDIPKVIETSNLKSLKEHTESIPKMILRNGPFLVVSAHDNPALR